jgi:hypothetical protein
MKMIAKNRNSITPLIIETNDGMKFEISGELIKGGYSAYKDSLILIKDNVEIELTEIERDKYTAQILEDFKNEKVATKFEIY